MATAKTKKTSVEKEFRKELGNLLKKYNARIGFGFTDDSDMDAVFGKHIFADFEVEGGKREKTTLAQGYHVYAVDLKGKG